MKIIKLVGEMEVITGLHIGGGDDTMRIGGIDTPVVKDINSDKPYVPGSSLKGKMRNLLEWSLGTPHITEGHPLESKYLDDPAFEEKKEALQTLLKLFGDKNGESGITRASFGDCQLSESSKEMKLSEAKFENTIDRVKGTALNPRQTERVPSGVRFIYDIRIKVLDEDDEQSFKDMIQKGLELIENDFLGGNGSRGYGRVKFHNKEQWEEIQL